MTVKEIVSLMIEGQSFKVKNNRGKVLYDGIKEYGRETEKAIVFSERVC